MISLRTLSKSRGCVPALILGLACAPSLGASSVPRGGTLDVSTEPAGAAVLLDDQAKGVTPLSIDGLTAGDHRVRLLKDGFLENSRVVSVAAGERQTLALRMTQDPATAAPQSGGEQGWLTKKKAIIGGAAVALLGIVLIATSGSSEGDNSPPVAGSIDVSPAGTGLAGITNYTFTSDGASDPENGPLTYSWNFGDGASGSGTSASHVFANGGNFTVTLSVSDGTHASTTSATVSVGDMIGTWVNIHGEPGLPGGIERRIRFEQSGPNLSGTYRISTSPGNTGSVTGRLSPPRNITFETKLKDPVTSEQLGFTFIGTVATDLRSFSGTAKGHKLTNASLLFGREE